MKYWSSEINFGISLPLDKKEDEDKDNKEEKKKEKEEKKETKSGNNSNSNSSSSGSGCSKPTSFPPTAPPTTDSLRLKCRDMLTNALKCSGQFAIRNFVIRNSYCFRHGAFCDTSLLCFLTGDYLSCK